MVLVGVSGTGGASAAGGVVGAGGEGSGAGGSSPDTCYSDSDCVRCIWETAPSDWNVCVGSYCCGGMITTTAQCEANQAAWNRYCPGQVPTAESCPCVFPTCQGQAMPSVACSGGRCGLWCPSVGGAGGGVPAAGGMIGAGGSTLGSGGVSGSGGYSGNDGTGGMAGGMAGSNAYGTPCTTNQDCPSDAVCCDGSDEACDATRLPAGDGPNPGELIVSSDGATVTDTITGLVWQRDGSGSRPNCAADPDCTWAESQAYCASLTLGGVSRWRVPARNELVTIVDFTKTNPPSIDETAFPNTPYASSDWFQTSTSDASAGGWRWNVGFYDGRSDGSEVGRVRCVRGSRCFPINRFAMLDGGLVRDTQTSLVWQRQAGPSMTWAAAQTYCSSAGSGFRAPTVKELISLVDLTVTSGETINQAAFPNMPVAPFWTSSPNETSSGSPWHVLFGWGGYSDGLDLVGEAAVVLCVR